eukprot:COSAG04_NODE_4210_length_2230_cov_4.947912_4_plen_97_part_01
MSFLKSLRKARQAQRSSGADGSADEGRSQDRGLSWHYPRHFPLDSERGVPPTNPCNEEPSLFAIGFLYLGTDAIRQLLPSGAERPPPPPPPPRPPPS